MNRLQNLTLAVAVIIVLGIGIAVGMSTNTPVAAQGKLGGGAGGNVRYSVIDTEGVHLIVTDNQKNTIFFYTVDQGEKPGADLHLRGTIDLNKVGDATIKPTLINPKKNP